MHILFACPDVCPQPPPAAVFEFPKFAAGTNAISTLLADLTTNSGALLGGDGKPAPGLMLRLAFPAGLLPDRMSGTQRAGRQPGFS